MIGENVPMHLHLYVSPFSVKKACAALAGFVHGCAQRSAVLHVWI
jgi:hypothetical protein